MLMQIDGTFIFVVISFIIFLLILKAILYNPVTKIINERDNFYHKNSKMELSSKEKTKALIEQKENAIKQTKKEANEIIKTAQYNAKEKYNEDIKQTKIKIQNSIQKKNNELLDEKFQAKNEIKQEVNSIVQAIVSKVLNENISININEDKIKKHLEI